MNLTCLPYRLTFFIDGLTGIELYDILHTCYITCVFLRASGAAGPQSSYHQPLLYSPHLENHSVLSRVPPGVEGGGRSDMHFTCMLKHSLVPFVLFKTFCSFKEGCLTGTSYYSDQKLFVIK